MTPSPMRYRQQRGPGGLEGVYRYGIELVASNVSIVFVFGFSGFQEYAIFSVLATSRG